MSSKMKPVIRAILYWNGLAEAFDKAYDFHLRVQNNPWLPLVVERHGDEISITHYVEQNGDQLRDPEMTFSRAEWGRIMGGAPGTWVPKSTEPGGLGRATPTGEIVRREGEPARLAYSPQRMKEALSFAAMWARNLRAQGFVRRYAAGEIESQTAIENTAQAPALLARGDRRVSRKGFSPPIGETWIDSVLKFV